MTVIDARSGRAVAVGETVRYSEGNAITLLEVRPGLFSASARVRGPAGETWVPLIVRWTHPSFLLQHVAFLPT